jgi:alkylhydroperoxidase family enzyme
MGLSSMHSRGVSNLKTCEVEKKDVEGLRAVGISDSEILDLVLLTGYMNLVTRIAQGLGVEHDEQEAREYRY